MSGTPEFSGLQVHPPSLGAEGSPASTAIPRNYGLAAPQATTTRDHVQCAFTDTTLRGRMIKMAFLSVDLQSRTHVGAPARLAAYSPGAGGTHTEEARQPSHNEPQLSSRREPTTGFFRRATGPDRGYRRSPTARMWPTRAAPGTNRCAEMHNRLVLAAHRITVGGEQPID